ncbi:MAG: universal stress protein [Flavisolibacter sp.]|jgi:nucleotide-binding universal stress UspA family protein|nr:universal stress protein [Flavisolibacter sp.]
MNETSFQSFHLCSMKTIIVSTDFSPATDVAISYAVSLATVTGSKILLLNVYQLPVSMNDFPVLMVSVDDLKNAAEAGLSGIKAEAQKKFTAVQFETESRLGDTADAIEAIVKERDTLCIVTGTQKQSGLEKFLLGNDTVPLMKNSSNPVIAVPEGSRATAPKNIVVAVDSTGADKIPVQKISSFVTALKAQLHIVHVETDEEEVSTSQQSLIDLFAPLPTTYHAIKSKDVTEGITNYLSQSGADLLMLLPHKHNLYERLFLKGHTSEIVGEVSLPVVCINA